MRIVGCCLLEGTVGKRRERVDPCVGRDLDAAGDASRFEQRRHDLVEVRTRAVVYTAKGREASEEETHVHLHGLRVAREVLKGSEDGCKLGGIGWVDVVLENDVALRGCEGLEFEVGNNAEGSTSAAQTPEEVWVRGR